MAPPNTFAQKEGTYELRHHEGRHADLLQGLGQRAARRLQHGWPLSADAWDDQMLFLGARGFRCIAHDRRGHGRSSQPWDGNEMNTYADDLATLVSALALENVVHVGHSTGGGEVARYLGRHGTKRAAKAVLIGAVPP
jgi:non-heme chloroperoxidase